MFAGIDNPEIWANFFFTGKIAFFLKKIVFKTTT